MRDDFDPRSIVFVLYVYFMVPMQVSMHVNRCESVRRSYRERETARG